MVSWVSVSEFRNDTFHATSAITATASTGAAIRANRGHQPGDREPSRFGEGSAATTAGRETVCGSGSIAAIKRSRTAGGAGTGGADSASIETACSASRS